MKSNVYTMSENNIVLISVFYDIILPYMYKTWTNPTIIIFRTINKVCLDKLRNLYYQTYTSDDEDAQNSVSCDLFNCCLLRPIFDPRIEQTDRYKEEYDNDYCEDTLTDIFYINNGVILLYDDSTPFTLNLELMNDYIIQLDSYINILISNSCNGFDPHEVGLCMNHFQQVTYVSEKIHGHTCISDRIARLFEPRIYEFIIAYVKEGKFSDEIVPCIVKKLGITRYVVRSIIAVIRHANMFMRAFSAFCIQSYDIYNIEKYWRFHDCREIYKIKHIPISLFNRKMAVLDRFVISLIKFGMYFDCFRSWIYLDSSCNYWYDKFKAHVTDVSDISCPLSNRETDKTRDEFNYHMPQYALDNNDLMHIKWVRSDGKLVFLE